MQGPHQAVVARLRRTSGGIESSAKGVGGYALCGLALVIGFREVSLVDLNEEAIERYTEPSENGYRLVRRAMPGEMLKSAALPGLSVPVDVVLA